MHEEDLRSELQAMGNESTRVAGDSHGALRSGRMRVTRRRAAVTIVAIGVVIAAVAILTREQPTRHRSVKIEAPTTTATTPMRARIASNASGVFFASASEGWLCANPMLHTADGGQTWQAIHLDARPETCGFSPTGGDAWAAARGHVIPVQGGSDACCTVGIATHDVVVQATFVDDTHGWLLTQSGDTSALYRTADGIGFTVVSSSAPEQIAFSSSELGWGTAYGRLEQTTDGGTSWHDVAVPGPRYLHDVSARGNTVVAVGSVPARGLSRPFFVVSDDGGQTWNLRAAFPRPLGTSATIVSIVDKSHWRFASGDVLWRTDDGGLTWVDLQLPGRAASLSFPTADIGWVTTDNHALYEMVGEATTWRRVDATPQPRWLDTLPSVPTGCPKEPIVSTTPDAAAAGQAALDFVRTTRGWIDPRVDAVYPASDAKGGIFGIVFASNVAQFCGDAVARNSFGVELSNDLITEDNSRFTALVVGHFASGWRVWGFYK